MLCNGCKHKQAAGLVPVTRLAESIANKWVDKMWPVVEDYQEKLKSYIPNITSKGIPEGLYYLLVSVTDDMRRSLGTYNRYTLSEYKETPTLKNIKADDTFKTIVVKLNVETRNVKSYTSGLDLGEFVPAGDTSTNHARIVVHINHIMMSNLLTYRGVYRDALENTLTSVLGHELHHAADWAYQQAINKNKFNLVNRRQQVPDSMADDTKKVRYYNSDTELKSWAITVGHDIVANIVGTNIWERPSTSATGSTEYLTKYINKYLNMGQEVYWDYAKGYLSKQEIWDYLLPENRKKFIQRVWSYVRKELEHTLNQLEQREANQ